MLRKQHSRGRFKSFMNRYKIFASDLDGTMLNSNCELSFENLNALEKITAEGVEFIPITGRCLDETPDEIKSCKFIRYIINSNGASIYDKQTGDLKTFKINKTAIKKIFEIISGYSVLLVVHSSNMDLVDTKDHSTDVFDYHNMSASYKSIIFPISKPVENLKERLLKDLPAEMICLFFKYEDERKSCFERLSHLKEIHATSSIGGNMEILSSKTSKGEALKNLAAALNISKSEIIAAGDNYNDVSLTLAAGLSLAVSSGVDEMKQKANKVICSNNENVADYVYRNFIKPL